MRKYHRLCMENPVEQLEMVNDKSYYLEKTRKEVLKEHFSKSH